MVLTSHFLTLIVWNNVAVKLSLIAIGAGALPGVTFRMSTVRVCLQSLFIGKYFSTVHSPPRGYIQSVVPSPLIRRPQSHRVQLLWLKNTPIPIFTRLSMEKTPPHPSSHNKPYTPKTCSLEMANFRMRTRTLERITLVEYTVAPVLASPSLALTGQLKTAQSQWDEYSAFLRPPCRPNQDISDEKTALIVKRSIVVCRCCRPPAWQKQWSHNNNSRGNNNNRTHNCWSKIATKLNQNWSRTHVKSINDTCSWQEKQTISQVEQKLDPLYGTKKFQHVFVCLSKLACSN